MKIYNLIDYFLMNDFTNHLEKYFHKEKKIIVFDIGSYKGFFSKKVLNTFKNSTLYMFDPQYEFDKNLLKLSGKRIHILKHALYSGFFTKKIYINNFLGSSGSGIDSPTYKDKIWNFSRKLFLLSLSDGYTIKYINTITLDSFIKKKKIFKIDILKIDVEGSELHVLKGAKKILKKTRLIQLEILSKKKYFNKKYNTILKFLEKYDFKVVKKKNILSTSILSNIKSIDLLLINNNLDIK